MSGNNNLESLDGVVPNPLPSLETLDISNSALSSLSITNFPNLRRLYLDQNRVSQIVGLSTHKTLSTLSWRSQSLPSSTEIDYHSAHNITSLHLSGNAFAIFAPSTPFFNLSTLELASTGLQNLSLDFGLQCPNLRVLNLNYNALHDLRPLLGIARLHKLYLAGNRVSRLRRTAAVLQHLSLEFAEVDLRNNPLTVGFYTPQTANLLGHKSEKRIVLSTGPAMADEDDLDDDTTAKAGDAYLLPRLDREADASARERLDEDTKLRRRVYEMLLVASCKELCMLDGLEVDKKEIGQRDEVWDRLKELGILRGKDATVKDDNESLDGE